MVPTIERKVNRIDKGSRWTWEGSTRSVPSPLGEQQSWLNTVLAMGSARSDEIAARYSARPDDYSGSATVALLDLVGAVASKREADLGCGHGTIARELARRGQVSSAWISRTRCSMRPEPGKR